MSTEHLTDYEKKQYNCTPLLPEPGPEVARELLKTINSLRGRIKQLEKGQ